MTIHEPRVIKKSKARILNSPVADSMARLTPGVMRDAALARVRAERREALRRFIEATNTPAEDQ
jgi:hypothetical protein